MRITLEVPDNLGERLQQIPEKWTEVIERGLQEVLNEKDSRFLDEAAIIELLASQPTPEEILAIRPSSEFQARASELLTRSKGGTSSAKDEVELERYLTIEHLVRLAKARAHEQLQKAA
ncbi:MAG: hypothetical protein AAF327_24300 [Cyanobacteria bacterium P01_A01_bin.37]